MIWWNRVDSARKLAEENQEVWVVTYSPEYAVSNYGRVVSKTYGVWKPMRGAISSAGYVTYGINGTTVLGHRLVVLSFDGGPPTEQHTDVRHLDGNKANNDLTNLRWGTRSENMNDVLQHRIAGKRSMRDEAIGQAQVEGVWFGGRTWDKDLVDICFRLEAENRLRLKDVAELLGVTPDVAHNIRSGRASNYPPPQESVGRYRRTPSQSSLIKQLINDGWDREQINSLSELQIGKPLTHQDFYYFKVSVYPEAKLEKKAPPPRRGEFHSMAKLTEEQVLHLFGQIQAGKFDSVEEIQHHLNLSKTATYALLSGRTWSHLPRSDSFKAALAKIQRKPRSTGPVGQDKSAEE